MKSILVSVIVPCYNYAHYLPETLDSVKNQSLQEWECIIIDDGSTDNTKEVAEKYCNEDNRFKYIYQTNKGLSNARNTGIKSSNGKYIQLLDADDLISTDKLKNQIEFLEANPEIDIVISSALSFKGEAKQNIECILPYGMIENPLEYFIVDNQIVVSAPIFRKTMIEKIGYFDEDLKSLEDWDFWLRACFNQLIFYYNSSNNDCTLIRQHAGSMKTDTWRMQYTSLKVRVKLKNQLTTKHQIKSNHFYINDYLKALAYLVNDEIKQNKLHEAKSKLELVYQTCPSFKYKLLKKYITYLPAQFYPKFVLILFESPINVLKAKLKFAIL